METKANTALIGAFTLIVLALGFVFVYWLARGSEQGNNVPLTVIFEDPVTGLTVGSLVVFNGINIGTVRTLTLDPDRPNVVVAELECAAAAVDQAGHDRHARFPGPHRRRLRRDGGRLAGPAADLGGDAGGAVACGGALQHAGPPRRGPHHPCPHRRDVAGRRASWCRTTSTT